MKDYYKILELPFGASPADIKRAYYRLAFKYHPDKNSGNPVFTELFKEINEAYFVLSDTGKRLLYHIEYNEYLHGREQIHKPIVTDYKDPRYRPPQPRGRATRMTNEFAGLKIAVVILFFMLISFLLYEARDHYNEKPVQVHYPSRRPPVNKITKDEYYEIIAKEFMQSHDSTLLKLDVDSVLHILDSMAEAKHH
jgi:curved DNA-binding protein CbpA